MPSDAASARGYVSQTLIPALQARLEAARAQSVSARAALVGQVPLAEAWPELAAQGAGEPRQLDAELLALDRLAVANLRDARTAPPQVDDRRLQARLDALWKDVVAAEREAVVARRPLVLALQDALGEQPAWTVRGVALASAPLDAAWRAAAATADALVDAPEPQARQGALDRMLSLSAARARWSQVAAQVRATAFTTVEIDPTPELAALASNDELLARDALTRLAAMRPLLEPERRAEADAAASAWVQGPGMARVAAARAQVQQDLAAVDEQPISSDLDALRGELTTAAAALAALEDAGLPEGSDPIHDALRQVAQGEASLAQERVELAASRLDHAEQVRTAVVDDERRRADAAREAADRASAATGDHPAVVRRAASRTWTADAEQVLADVRAARTAERTDRMERFERLQQAAKALLDDRAPEGDAAAWTIDTVYARNRTLVAELRKAVDAAIAPPETLLADLPALPEGRDEELAGWLAEAEASTGPERDAVIALLEDTRQALVEEQVPVREAADLQAASLEHVLADLRAAKSLRHSLRSQISSSERALDARTRGTDVLAEARLFGHQVRALATERLRELLQIPALLVDPRRWLDAVQEVVTLLRGMVVLVLMVLGWWILRRRSGPLADRVLSFGNTWVVTLDATAREALRPTMSMVVRAALDVALAWLVAGRLGELAVEVGIAVRALGVWAMLRGLGVALDLVLGAPEERRPSFAVLSEEGRALVHRSWRLAAVWWFTGWLIDRILADLIFADALADLVTTVWWLVASVLAVWVLVRWEPRMLARVQRMGAPPAWMTRFVATRSGGVLAPVRSLVLLGYLTASGIWDIAQGRAATRDGYGALYSAMDRVRFGAEAAETAGLPGLPPEQMEAMCSADVPSAAVVPRKAAEEALSGHLTAWNNDRRLGVVVLTGDRGDGKRVFLERMDSVLRVDGRPPRIGELDRRITSQQDAIAWFSAWFELDPVPDDLDTLVDRLLEAPPQVHIVRRAQLSFLRCVHGFDGLATILDVCNATSVRHFWLLGMHRPAWAYLSRLGALVNTGVVRGVVDIAPLTGPELRDLVLRRTEAQGLTVDFRRLENTGPFSAPPDVERERAISSYFRLLADGTGGCPLVALHVWSRSLRQAAHDAWDVVLVPELGGGDLGDVDDDELFVLSALRIQDQMTLEELASVLNMRLDDVRSVVRELSQRSILHMSDSGVRIDTLKVRRASRALRRRHFLQYAV